jgi:hypothetical protein
VKGLDVRFCLRGHRWCCGVLTLSGVRVGDEGLDLNGPFEKRGFLATVFEGREET